MIEESSLKEIGKFQKTHGLKGELNAIIDIDCDFFEDGNPLIIKIDGIFVPFYVESVREKGKTSFLIKIEGISDEKEASRFVNHHIYAEKSKMAEFLEIDESEIADDNELMGYSVYNDDKIIGIIEGIESSTQNILLIIEGDDGQEIYIPLVEDFIMEINNENKYLKMILPEGIVDLNKKLEK